jgi:small subunit ribosomal protein S6
MREYEIFFIAHPDLEESALNDVAEKVKGWVTEAGGTVLKADFWGRRRLAYAIRKQKEGQYICSKSTAPTW